MTTEAFRTSPEFAMVLDQLVEATQRGDTATVNEILTAHPAWRAALEEERRFLLHVEETRPAEPAKRQTGPVVPPAAHTLPMPLAQAWVATLDATSTAARTEAALFAFESFAVYLAAVAVGVYDATECEDPSVTQALKRLGREREPERWLDTIDQIARWRDEAAEQNGAVGANGDGSGPDDGRDGAARPAVPAAYGRILSQLEATLEAAITDPGLIELADWLATLRGGNGKAATGARTVRGLLAAILAQSASYRQRARHSARGTDAERTAELLETGIGSLFGADAFLRDLPCGYVRSVERIGKNLFQHDVIDLVGLSPLTRRGGLLHPGTQLEPGRVYVFPSGGASGAEPISTHPFIVYQQGQPLRLSLERDGDDLSYTACRPGEGRVSQPVNGTGHGRIESLVLPRTGRVAPAPAAMLPGGKAQIGDFRILRQIGEGGMALVYLAEQRSIGREVALKVLHRTRLTSSFIERFRREGKAIGRLEHPNIVKVHAIGEEDGIPYLAMEYVHGAALDERIRNGDQARNASDPAHRLPRAIGDRSPMETVCRITREIAMALDHAHDHGIIHRDVKPGNVLIDEEGHAHLTDFGLAQEVGKASLTMTGDMVGTPHFLSPEQVAAKRIEIDHRTDIYSLGVTLYQMLTDRMPFEGESLEQILRQIALKEPIAPRKVNPRIPRDLETICLHAMEKDPDARYASAREMADDLRAVAELRPIQASRAGAMSRALKLARRRPAVAVLSTLLALAVLTWVGTVWARHARDTAIVRQNMEFGTKLLDADRPDKALPYFERVLDVMPGHDVASTKLNQIRYTLERERAIELAFDWENPSDPDGIDRCLESIRKLREYRRESADVQLLEAQVRVRRGRIDPARMPEALTFVERLDADKPGIKLLRAIALGGCDRVTEAKRVRAEAESTEIDSPDDRLVVAEALMVEGRWREALVHYETVLQRGDLPTRRAASSQAARCCYWLGEYRRALDYLRFLESEHRTQPPHLLRRRAIYSWRLGDATGAAADLDRALAQAPDYVLALNARGVIRHRQRRFKDALEDFNRAIRNDPEFVYAYAHRGQVRYQLGDFDRAIEDLDRAVEMNPRLRAARLARARVYNRHGNGLAQRRKTREAHAIRNKALSDLRTLVSSFGERDADVAPLNAEDRRILATALALRSEVYLQLEEHSFAAVDSARAIEVDPTVAYGHYVSALISLGRQDEVEAREALDRAIRLDPGFPPAYGVRAELTYNAAMRKIASRPPADEPDLDSGVDLALLESALDDVNEVLELEPNMPESLTNRAWLHLLIAQHKRATAAPADILEHVRQAEKDGDAALAIVPSAEALLVLYEVSHFTNAVGDAAVALEEALALNPRSWMVLNKLTSFYHWVTTSKPEGAPETLSPGSGHARVVAIAEEALRQANAVDADRRAPPNLVTTVERRRDQSRGRAARAFFRGEPADTPLERAIFAFALAHRKQNEKAMAELVEAAAAARSAKTKAGTVARIEQKCALLEIASLAAKLGDTDLALACVNTLVSLDPTHDRALALRRSLRAKR